MLPSEKYRAMRGEIRKVMERYPELSNLRLCGSVARGEDTEDSDVDFLVDAGARATLFDLGGLREDLEGLLGVPVDVISSRSRMNEDMRNVIMKEAVSV